MLRIILSLAAAGLLTVPSLADTQVFGPFRINPEHPEIAVLVGDIGADAPLQFRRAFEAFPDIQTLGLSSPGGDVTAALLVALEVYDRGIDTRITADWACFSACAYVFLAGASRTMEGQLGVHMAKPIEDYEGSRVLIEDDIRFVMSKVDVPIFVLDGILNTPNDEIRIFDAAEAESIGLNR